MSSDRVVIIARNTRTDELKIEPDMTLYDLDGAKSVLETVITVAKLSWPDYDDWVFDIYTRYWEPHEN